MPSATIVTGLGFGDEGKGTIVDWLTRQYPAGSVTVVRHNGGAQAAHNVVTDDGRHHTFAQFGAGTLAGAATHLSKFMLINPLNWESECEGLSKCGVNSWSGPRALTVDPDALIITPFHRSANRFLEHQRGEDRHGSCGQGIGETMRMSIEHPDLSIRVKDLALINVVVAKLHAIQDTLAKETGLDSDIDDETLVYIAQRFEVWVSRVEVLTDAMVLALAENVIFEGAQGVLLDETYGFAPYNTWSTTTSHNAHTLLDQAGYTGSRRTIGVTRSYQTRHGAGPLPSESEDVRIPEPHNAPSEWQGCWRQGWLDLNLLRYALRSDGRIDELAVTHLDSMEVYGQRRWLVREAGLNFNWHPDEFLPMLADATEKPITIGSWGPKASAKRSLTEIGALMELVG